MSPTYSTPGSYVEEVPSHRRPLAAASTSETAFVDWFPQGPDDRAVRVTSIGELTHAFGELHAQSHGSYAVRQFFENGGAVAWIVRATLPGDLPASAVLADSDGIVATAATASSPGSWGDSLRVAVTAGGPAGTIDLLVGQGSASGTVTVRETHRGLPASDPAAKVQTVNASSTLVSLNDVTATSSPPATVEVDAEGQPTAWVSLIGGADAAVFTGGGTPVDSAALAAALAGALTVVGSTAPTFNLLCLPSIGSLGEEYAGLADAATAYCRDHDAFLILDPPVGPDTATATAVTGWLQTAGAPTPSASGALYWPRLTVPDPLAGSAPRDLGPCGAVAGVYARTDATRGVWKAPAGADATLVGAVPATPITDVANSVLNPVGINALRTFPGAAPAVWGARTLLGGDVHGSDWKYVPVRRMALFLKRSLGAGLQWAVFEPNEAALWGGIRHHVTGFMEGLFRQGAFQGGSAKEAYVVRCDAGTITQADLDDGVAQLVVGFALLKPAEFVILNIRVRTGQSAP